MINIIPFEKELIEAKIIKREKRFFIEFVDKETSLQDIQEGKYTSLFAHTNNTGSMMGLIQRGRSILLSKSDNPNRKLAYTLEAICIDEKIKEIYQNKCEKISPWLGVNTSIPNKFLQALFLQNAQYDYKLLPFAKDFTEIKMEAKNGESRLDACLWSKEHEQKLWIECKNVSMVEYDSAAFPDAVSERGQKHLETLMRLKKEGNRCAMFYVVQRTEAQCFMPAEFIDTVYTEKLIQAYKEGVEIYAVVANVQKNGIYWGEYLKLAPCYFK